MNLRGKALAALITICFAGGGLLIPKNSESKEVNASTTTLVSNFRADYSRLLSTGNFTADSSQQLFLSNGDSNINNVPLYLYDNGNYENNINFTFSGNNSSYAKGNVLRDYQSGAQYIQLRHSSIVRGDGGTLEISSNSNNYIIKSISLKLHTRSGSSGGSYHHVVKNGVSSYHEFSELFNSGNSNTYTCSDENGISDFKFSISLKQSPVGSNEKYVYIEYVSVDYEYCGSTVDLSFDTDGGSSIETQEVAVGHNGTRPGDPTKSFDGEYYYHFDDWYTSKDGNTKFDFSSPLNEDTVAYAHWLKSSSQFRIYHFESNGGSTVNDILTNDGSVVIKPDDPVYTPSDPEKYSVSFDCWCTDSALKHPYDWTTVVSSDLTLYARYSYALNAAPSGAEYYSVHTHADVWASTSHFTNDAWYGDVTLDSYETFDSSHNNTRISLHIQRSDNSHGFQVHGVWSQLVHTSTIEISMPSNEDKVFTYLRFDFGDWGASSNKFVNMYKNDSESASDTCTIPNSVEKTHFVQSSFSINENVKSVRITTPNVRLVLQSIYILTAQSGATSEAIAFATGFNDANVCGTSDTDGLNTSKWEEQAELYDDLSTQAKAVFNNYSGDDAEILECLERYDRVIYLHGEDYDFMGRIESDNIPTISSQKIGLFVSNITHNNSSIVLIALSSFSVLAITAFFVTRRKEND